MWWDLYQERSNVPNAMKRNRYLFLTTKQNQRMGKEPIVEIAKRKPIKNLVDCDNVKYYENLERCRWQRSN